ncbi:MAG: TIGR01212 family radical SAM protein [Clostridia bacterium]|nr:TIGR01212 family radical SAM protein [Clostridia bacterium]
MQPYYYSFNEYVQSRFGEKLYKLSLETGCTCPTRDGTLGTDGCIFCSAGGSGEFAEKPHEDIHLQIEQAKAQISKKFKGTHYIAYFQSYTNTYGDIARLRQIYFAAAENPCVKAVSIATRPDCLPPEVLQMLKELNEIKPVFVELGLQTIHESTAQFIRRGYPLPVYEQAVSDLHGIGVHVVTHLILGLPQETKEQMLESVRYVGKIGTNGVKLQLLHVLKGTDLEKIYRSGAFRTLEKEEYIDLLCDCIEVLPQNTVIHRLTGDAPKALLVAPTWSSNKKDVLNSVHRAFLARDIRQGEKAL